MISSALASAATWKLNSEWKIVLSLLCKSAFQISRSYKMFFYYDYRIHSWKISSVKQQQYWPKMFWFCFWFIWKRKGSFMYLFTFQMPPKQEADQAKAWKLRLHWLLSRVGISKKVDGRQSWDPDPGTAGGSQAVLSPLHQSPSQKEISFPLLHCAFILSDQILFFLISYSYHI